MLSVIILDNHEPNVIRLTYENLWRELKDIEGSELLVADDWFKPLGAVKNPYVCLVEPDCLVSSGYFASMIGLWKKELKYQRRVAIFGSATGVNQFGNRFYGFALNTRWSRPLELKSGERLSTATWMAEPVRTKGSTAPYPVQIVYVPGALINTGMLRDLVLDGVVNQELARDLVKFSAKLCLHFWGTEGRIYINPNTTYVTTENYVNDLVETDAYTPDLISLFKREVI